jgi:hypothetical protein
MLVAPKVANVMACMDFPCVLVNQVQTLSKVDCISNNVQGLDQVKFV